ncbi:hypothetical protein ACFVKB_07865 [Rhodococcus sp. NPDC127530]|uniref:hypothetical protein n=1 Tax=unclassified Rhodococcus (in: high G+C Gram-positive bacteria) TaxID=192944 RepID=UPI00362D3A11
MNHEDNGGAAIYDLPMTNLHEALAQIDKANARLARNNIAERFTYDLDPYTREETNASASPPHRNACV